MSKIPNYPFKAFMTCISDRCILKSLTRTLTTSVFDYWETGRALALLHISGLDVHPGSESDSGTHPSSFTAAPNARRRQVRLRQDLQSTASHQRGRGEDREDTHIMFGLRTDTHTDMTA